MNGFWNNDYFGGDLKGIAEKLPYIAKLGVTAIYLNPIFEAHSNHRYDTGDYEKIDPMLGDTEDLKYLCSQAKKTGDRRDLGRCVQPHRSGFQVF